MTSAVSGDSKGGNRMLTTRRSANHFDSSAIFLELSASTTIFTTLVVVLIATFVGFHFLRLRPVTTKASVEGLAFIPILLQVHELHNTTVACVEETDEILLFAHLKWAWFVRLLELIC